MRWHRKQEYTKSGDFEIVTRFLFLPKIIDGETRWLEKATWERKYNILAFNSFSSWLSGRVDTNWID